MNIKTTTKKTVDNAAYLVSKMHGSNISYFCNFESFEKSIAE